MKKQILVGSAIVIVALSIFYVLRESPNTEPSPENKTERVEPIARPEPFSQNRQSVSEKPATIQRADPTETEKHSVAPVESSAKLPTARLTGRLRDRSGNPILIEAIAVLTRSTRKDEARSGWTRSIPTDEEGNYSFDLEPGSYVLSLTRHLGLTSSVQFEMKGSDLLQDLVINGTRVLGHVQAGRKSGARYIYLLSEDNGQKLMTSWDLYRSRDYQFLGIPAGRHQLVIKGARDEESSEQKTFTEREIQVQESDLDLHFDFSVE